jgi:hypothetical protein
MSTLSAAKNFSARISRPMLYCPILGVRTNVLSTTWSTEQARRNMDIKNCITVHNKPSRMASNTSRWTLVVLIRLAAQSSVRPSIPCFVGIMIHANAILTLKIFPTLFTRQMRIGYPSIREHYIKTESMKILNKIGELNSDRPDGLLVVGRFKNSSPRNQCHFSLKNGGVLETKTHWKKRSKK